MQSLVRDYIFHIVSLSDIEGVDINDDQRKIVRSLRSMLELFKVWTNTKRVLSHSTPAFPITFDWDIHLSVSNAFEHLIMYLIEHSVKFDKFYKFCKIRSIMLFLKVCFSTSSNSKELNTYDVIKQKATDQTIINFMTALGRKWIKLAEILDWEYSSEDLQNFNQDQFINNILEETLQLIPNTNCDKPTMIKSFIRAKRKLGVALVKREFYRSSDSIKFYSLGPYFKYNFTHLENCLSDFALNNSKKNWYYCKKQATRSALCLTWGTKMCIIEWPDSRDLPLSFQGNLTKHSLEWGNRVSIFISILNGKIFYMFEGLSAENKSPYVNEFDEAWDIRVQDKFDKYYLSEDALQ